MTLNRNDSQFSSKELNKILPSYLLEEIDKENSDSETQDTNQSISFNNTNSEKMYKLNNNFPCNNKKINTGNRNNIFINIMNKESNYSFCNNNINYNCFNITNGLFPNNTGNNYISYFCKNNILNNINNINILNTLNFGSNDVNINYINIIQNNSTISNNNISLESFMEYINNIPISLIDFVCNSKGALELQKMLENAGSDIKIYFIQILKKEGITQIMTNIHGNYFFQKLIKDSSEKIITSIISYILDDFIEISKDDSGTFSVQALLNEITSINDMNKILQKIKGKEIGMIYDKNATYVIQKMILKIPDFYRKGLNEIILQYFSKLCLDVNGICLVKNFIKTNSIENDKQKMKNIIINNFVLLAQSPFGNYAIQFLIEKLRTNELNEIVEVLNENLFKLSVQQFSSNVVEKSLEKMDDINLGKILDKLFFQGKFIFLLKNKFGKYVINKAINYMPKELKAKFQSNLIQDLNSGLFNNKDKNRIKKFLIKLNNNTFVNYNNYNFCIDINCNNKKQF